jgi:hypothetical protein
VLAKDGTEKTEVQKSPRMKARMNPPFDFAFAFAFAAFAVFVAFALPVSPLSWKS